jgi:hypothetical protein
VTGALRSAVAIAALAACALGHAQAPTRRPPAVPPDKAAKPIESATLVNAGFESTRDGQLGAPEGWWAVQHAGPRSYTFDLDTAKPHSGTRSLRIENVGPEAFGSIYQKVAARPYRGRTLRLAAWVRTREAKGNRFGAGAGLVLQAMRGGYSAAHAMMRKDAIHGTTDWTRYEVRLAIPADADEIELGLNLYGPGMAWLDDVTLDVVAAAPPPAAASN